MKTRIRRILALLLVTLVMSGCKWADTYDYSPYHHIFLEEMAYLIPDNDQTPYCDFSADYSCLKPGSDSVLHRMNEAMQREFLGETYATLSPDAAVDSFKYDYLHQYRDEVNGMYQADLKQGIQHEECPAWYNRTYSIVTFVEEGHKGTLNATANWFEDMGGAHPNQWSRWINFDTDMGRMLAREDVFKAEAQKEIEQILLDKLIQQQAALYPNDTIKTLEDLHAKGFLNFTPIYIPDNFLLSKKNLLFLFNRYDIAPYAAGEIVLEVPYEEIGHCLLVK